MLKSSPLGPRSALTLFVPLAAALSLSACGQRDGGDAINGNDMSANSMTADPNSMSDTMMPSTNSMSGQPGDMGTGGLPPTGDGETGMAPGGNAQP